MSGRTELRLDWCTYEAAKYAVERWHYSRCMPASKLVRIGVWEDGRFVGVVIYGGGATPSLYKWTQACFGIGSTQACELVRVALDRHKTPVSKVLAISMRMLRRKCPGLRLIVSYADADQDHHGGIYQANGWTFVGTTSIGQRSAFIIHGRKVHPRSVGAMGLAQTIASVKRIDPMATEAITAGKHKYLMPLDDDMRARIAPLAQPYPKRAGSAASGTPDLQSGRGGATPTPALSTDEATP